MFWVMINISNYCILIQSKEVVHVNHTCTREREREREREIICYIVYDKYSKTFRLLFSKNTLLLPANASRSVDLPQPKGIIIARSSLGGA